MNPTKGMKPGTSDCCAYGVAGRTFTSSPPVVVQRKQGHLERPASKELAVGISGKISCTGAKGKS